MVRRRPSTSAASPDGTSKTISGYFPDGIDCTDLHVGQVSFKEEKDEKRFKEAQVFQESVGTEFISTEYLC